MLCKDIELEWPERVKTALAYFSSFQSSQKNLLSFDCIMLFFGFSREEAFYGKILIFGLLPIIFSLFGATIWVAIKYTLKRNDKNFKVLRNIQITCYAIVLITFPTVTTMSFSIFQCFSYEDGHSYVLTNMLIQCWS